MVGSEGIFGFIALVLLQIPLYFIKVERASLLLLLLSITIIIIPYSSPRSRACPSDLTLTAAWRIHLVRRYLVNQLIDIV